MLLVDFGKKNSTFSHDGDEAVWRNCVLIFLSVNSFRTGSHILRQRFVDNMIFVHVIVRQ